MDYSGYNLAVLQLTLHDLAYRTHANIQRSHGNTIANLNGKLRDLSQLNRLLTESQPSGSALLSLHHNLIDRIRLASKDVLCDSNTYHWSTPQSIQAQTDRIKEKIHEYSQEINLLYTKMGQKEKDMSEVSQAFTDMLKQQTELIRRILQAMT